MESLQNIQLGELPPPRLVAPLAELMVVAAVVPEPEVDQAAQDLASYRARAQAAYKANLLSSRSRPQSYFVKQLADYNP